jgi:hypothetical protein
MSFPRKFPIFVLYFAKINGNIGNQLTESGLILKEINPKQKVAILRILRDAREPIGSAIIAEEIKAYGFDLSGARSVFISTKWSANN